MLAYQVASLQHVTCTGRVEPINIEGRFFFPKAKSVPIMKPQIKNTGC